AAPISYKTRSGNIFRELVNKVSESHQPRDPRQAETERKGTAQITFLPSGRTISTRASVEWGVGYIDETSHILLSFNTPTCPQSQPHVGAAKAKRRTAASFYLFFYPPSTLRRKRLHVGGLLEYFPDRAACND